MAKSTFARQNVENTSASETFWKFQCSKMPRRCGEKHICKSKCGKHHRGGAILEVPTLKNCTPLWREAYLYVKMWKTPQSRSDFGRCDVQKWHAAVAPSIFVSQNVENTTLSGHFLKFTCPKMARRCGAKHICKAKYTKHLRFVAFREVSN